MQMQTSRYLIELRENERPDLCDFLSNIVFDVRHDGELVAVFHRRDVTVSVAFLQRALQVWSDVASERRSAAAVADRKVPGGLGQLKPYLGRAYRRPMGLASCRVVRRSIAVQVGIEPITRPATNAQSHRAHTSK